MGMPAHPSHWNPDLVPDDGNRYELIDGVLLRESSSGLAAPLSAPPRRRVNQFVVDSNQTALLTRTDRRKPHCGPAPASVT